MHSNAIRVKKLNLLIIKAYLGPFVLTFFIAIFVLVMQFLWKYVDELAGKGLDAITLLELIFYASATLVPLALPLAILLSSIMTLGNMAENLEIVAIKSAGISLLKMLRPLIVVAIITSLGAFLFANYGMPVANYKLKTLLINIRQTQATIDVQEGVFYEGLERMILRVDKKDKDGKTLHNIIIRDHTDGGAGNASTVIAKKAEITTTKDGNFMSLKLFDGVRYDDKEFYYRKGERYPLTREFFKTQELLIDLSGFKVEKKDQSFLRNQYTMMNISQLNEIKNDLYDDLSSAYQTYYNSLNQKYTYSDTSDGANTIPKWNDITQESEVSQPSIVSVNFNLPNFLDNYNEENKSIIKNKALEHLGILESDLKNQKNTLAVKNSIIARNRAEWHRKFSLSFACLILFFVGAPLGAIIRKGGLGLPLIFCIIIFIVYYIISTIGEKSVMQLKMSPFQGMWLSSVIFLPIGLFLTLKASTDSPIFMAETYRNFFKKLLNK